MDLAPFLIALHLESDATAEQIANGVDLLLKNTPAASFAPAVHLAIRIGEPKLALAILHALSVDPKTLSIAIQKFAAIPMIPMS